MCLTILLTFSLLSLRCSIIDLSLILALSASSLISVASPPLRAIPLAVAFSVSIFA